MPQAFNFHHIGINVPDIEAAVKWYMDVFHGELITSPVQVNVDGGYFGALCEDIFKQNFKSMKLARVSTGNGVGLEFFQFLEPETVTPDNTFEWKRAGIFHFCMYAKDINETVEKIVSNGGKRLSETWKLHANKPYKCVYTQDPWGTVIELATHSFDQMNSNTEPYIEF